MRCVHLARATVLARVAVFGKNVVPLFRLWTGVGRLGIRPAAAGCHHRFDDGCFHKFRLPLFHGRLAWFGGKRRGYTALRRKLARSSASSQSNVLFVSGLSMSREQFSMKEARLSGFFIGLPASISSDQVLISTGVFVVPLACSQVPTSS